MICLVYTFDFRLVVQDSTLFLIRIERLKFNEPTKPIKDKVDEYSLAQKNDLKNVLKVIDPFYKVKILNIDQR